jgi:cellulose biosynthesis protein BcsQ
MKASPPNNRITVSKIITFYSFKGGVGRSMALANVAMMLAQWGYKTLMIDWDLEAPGLENFFSTYIDTKSVKVKPGLIDLLGQAANNEKSKGTLHWKDCIVPIFVKTASKSFQADLITAGAIDEAYYDKVRSFDFNNFYERHDGGNVLEKLRSEWLENYDFVLIDSRTGVTDVGGVCTIQLPDILVVLFTPTQQSLEGVKRVALKAMAAQRKLPFDRLNLLTLPVPTRIDNTEYKLSKQWFERFETELKQIYTSWFPESESGVLNRFLLNSKVPYISYFSFGEKLPVLEEGVADPAGIGFAYQSISSLLATQLDYPDLLVENRSRLIEFARFPESRARTNNSSPSRKNLSKFYREAFSQAYRSFKRPVSISYIFIFMTLALFIVGVTFLINASNEKVALRNELDAERIKYDSLERMQFVVNDSISSSEHYNLRSVYRLKNTVTELKYATYKAQKADPSIGKLVMQLDEEIERLEAKNYGSALK